MKKIFDQVNNYKTLKSLQSKMALLFLITLIITIADFLVLVFNLEADISIFGVLYQDIPSNYTDKFVAFAAGVSVTSFAAVLYLYPHVAKISSEDAIRLYLEFCKGEPKLEAVIEAIQAQDRYPTQRESELIRSYVAKKQWKSCLKD